MNQIASSSSKNDTLRSKLYRFTFLALPLLLISCGPSSGYRGFTSQNESYYSRFADGCEKLRSQEPTIGAAAAQKLAAQSDLLAPEIKELRPEYIFVTTNGVQIQIGHGQLSYAIGWSKTDDGRAWKLSASNEGIGRILYVRRNQ